MFSGRRAVQGWQRHCLTLTRVPSQSRAPLPGIVGALQRKFRVTDAYGSASRPNLVVVGTGWAATELLCNLSKKTVATYDINVLSQTNHFVNTPLLPSITVGTVDPRSIVHPIREVLAKHRRKVENAYLTFNRANVVEVDPDRKRVRCISRGNIHRTDNILKDEQNRLMDDTSHDDTEYWINYDVLVMATGATTNTFGTPGALENCQFLKTVQDALRIRCTVLDNFERAAVEVDNPEEIQRLLTFVIVGAGPTGVEIAAELRDFIKEDVMHQYSGLKKYEIKVQIVEMSSKMLGTYEKVIQEYAADQFKRLDIEMFTEHQVKQVGVDYVEVLDLKTREVKRLPFGMCVWASGVKPSQVSLDLAKTLHGGGMLQTDAFLRVRGQEGSIFALGDCAKITMPTLAASATDMFIQADINKDGELQLEEFKAMIKNARTKYPHLEAYLAAAGEHAVESLYDHAHEKGKVTQEVFAAACAEVDRQMKMLPPTAQVAAQEGAYLAKLINGVPFEKLNHEAGFDEEFKYQHQGSLAYVGGESAVFQSNFGVFKGMATYAMWKVVYFYSSVSFRMRLNLLFNWAKTWFMGRDTSQF